MSFDLNVYLPETPSLAEVNESFARLNTGCSIESADAAPSSLLEWSGWVPVPVDLEGFCAVGGFELYPGSISENEDESPDLAKDKLNVLQSCTVEFFLSSKALDPPSVYSAWAFAAAVLSAKGGLVLDPQEGDYLDAREVAEALESAREEFLCDIEEMDDDEAGECHEEYREAKEAYEIDQLKEELTALCCRADDGDLRSWLKKNRTRREKIATALDVAWRSNRASSAKTIVDLASESVLEGHLAEAATRVGFSSTRYLEFLLDAGVDKAIGDAAAKSLAGASLTKDNRRLLEQRGVL